jgi:hypothetical protein
VFKDTASLEAGTEFSVVIEQVLRSAFVVLVVIGANWVGVNKDGSCRIDDERDFVRKEVSIALKLRARIIPLLIDGATIPQHLPADIQGLANLQALRIRQDPDFQGDLTILLAQLRSISPERLRPTISERVREVQPKAFGDRTLLGTQSEAGPPTGQPLGCDPNYRIFLGSPDSMGSVALPVLEDWYRQLSAQRRELGERRLDGPGALGEFIKQQAQALRQSQGANVLLGVYLVVHRTERAASILVKVGLSSDN